MKLFQSVGVMSISASLSNLAIAHVAEEHDREPKNDKFIQNGHSFSFFLFLLLFGYILRLFYVYRISTHEDNFFENSEASEGVELDSDLETNVDELHEDIISDQLFLPTPIRPSSGSGNGNSSGGSPGSRLMYRGDGGGGGGGGEIGRTAAGAEISRLSDGNHHVTMYCIHRTYLRF